MPPTGPAGAAADLGAMDWADELDVRTACPVHQARLTGDSAIVRGQLATPVPANLAGAVHRLNLTDLGAPTLLLHGTADVIATLSGARAYAARLPNAELAVVDGGRHDILNDAHHRTVAAHVTQWLERLRISPHAAPILTVEQAIPRGGTQ
jgi:alpha-beta hydrolase superfamily lysophospholipase